MAPATYPAEATSDVGVVAPPCRRYACAGARRAPPNGSGTVMTPWNWIVRLVPLVCIGVLASLVSALPVTLAT